MRIPGRTVLVAAFTIASAVSSSAQLGSRTTDEWIRTLESPQRIAGLKIDETIACLDLKPGTVVADIGAGSEVFEAPLARAVGPNGKVYAVDIDQGLLDNIAKKQREFHISNIVTVLGKFSDPALPSKDIDLALINDVLHHIDNRAEYLKNLAKYTKPAARIGLIEFYPEKGGHRTQPELQVTKEQATSWMGPQDSGRCKSSTCSRTSTSSSTAASPTWRRHAGEAALRS